MKRISLIFLTLALAATLAFNPSYLIAQAQEGSETPDDTPTPTETSEPTATPAPGTRRPVVVVASYKTNPESFAPGADFDLNLKLMNSGQTAARNLIVTFSPGDLIPRKTGGVLTAAKLPPGETKTLKQPLTASSALAPNSAVTMGVSISYSDDDGASYGESFTITVGLSRPVYTSGPARTPTPTVIKRPQLVITGYQTDIEALLPGTRFDLEVQVSNVGTADAKQVAMVSGGATAASGDGSDSQNRGGVSTSGGEFGNFSPLGVSNVQSLGDLKAGEQTTAHQPLIVNVSTEPGAYSFKVSFVYLEEKGDLRIDDQVITLLVYAPLLVDVTFYRDPGPMFAGQPNMLPLQIVNLGRRVTVLGNMKVSAEGAQLENNTLLVGTLEPGGYLTLDATLIPEAPGPLELVATINFTDDFNQPQTLTFQLSVEVMEGEVFDPGVGPGMEPGMPGPGLPAEPQPETFWQKALRFFKGLIGLDSGTPTPPVFEGGPEEMPPGEPLPVEVPVIPVPVP